MSARRSKHRFQLVLIRPSHYDNEGNVVQRGRSSIPANSLCCLYALALDAAERQVLGPEVAIDITAIDETNTRVRTQEIIVQLARHDGFGMVGLIGVQPNQFPRSLDIARPLRAAGISVVISGSPVTGPLAMLPGTQNDRKQALDMGCSLFAGDAENGRIDVVIRDAANGALQSLYDQVPALPTLESGPSPFMPQEVARRLIDHYASFDAGRGCPFQCSFCAKAILHDHKSHRHPPDEVERSIRAHYQQRVPWFFITDDGFVRNEDWEPIFDRIILLRERDKIRLKIAIQVDARCHEIPNFVAKAACAGVRKAFIGVENVDPANLRAGKKRQNKTTEYRSAMLAWQKAGVITYAGHILGSQNDTSESIQDKRELRADTPDFFCYAAASSRVRGATPMSCGDQSPEQFSPDLSAKS